MTSPDSLERPIFSGSVPSGSSSPAFGPLVMTMRETVLVVAAPPTAASFAFAGAAAGAGRLTASVASPGPAAGAGTGAAAGPGSFRAFTPNRSGRRVYNTPEQQNHSRQKIRKDRGAE